eukprot:PITA_22307
MAFEQKCDKQMGLSSWIRRVNGGPKCRVVECIPPLDLSAVSSSSNSTKLVSNLSGFGSPVAVMEGFEHRTSSDDNQDGWSGFVRTFRPAAFTIPGKQSGAQLTIFYGRTVNVYDDIPADKAKAIMLMASSGNYPSFPHNNVEDGGGSQAWRKISGINLSEQSGINSPPLSSKVNTDIPLARKHSLQCFLEKRKARVNAKARCPYKIEEAEPH